MKHAKMITGIGAAAGMLLLILDGKTAIAGAQDGVELCLRTVIPSLFPFFVLSIALTGSLSGIQIPFLRPLGKLCRIPQGSEAILLTGFLGGYPVGAQAVCSTYQAGQLSRTQANRMLAFCNNAGPAFLFGMIASQFPDSRYAWLLWGIHMLSAVLASLMLPAGDLTPVKLTDGKALSMSGCLRKALTVMANVCGWVILFRVLIAFLNRWFLWMLPVPAQVLLTGILELTNGCCSLTRIGNIGLRFILCAGMLTFGGLCVTMQTISVISGLSSSRYLTGKLLQTQFCVLLAVVCQPLLPPHLRYPLPAVTIAAAVCILSGSLLLAGKRQKNSSNPALAGV